ncbi:MAG: HD domain-containing protein [Gemmatimonadota bacterium]
MKGTTEPGRAVRAPLHPMVRAAGEEGRLPAWGQPGGRWRDHLLRVADQLGGWAKELGHAPEECIRWRAAGLFHDLLKGVDADELRIWARRPWPAPLLHGPAVAARLRGEGVRDDEFLLALEHHSVGHVGFGDVGRFLYLADFLDPGRRFRRAARARLRERLPAEADEVLLEVVALRLQHELEARHELLPESLEFWNRLVGEAGA